MSTNSFDKTIESIEDAFRTSFIDQSIESEYEYRPQMIVNDRESGQKIISEIESELLHCKEFAISVAFITESGIAPLLQTLRQLEEKGIPGRILTTNYLTFSEPKALRKLAGFKNIKLRMYYVSGNDAGFHPKAYLFKRDEIYRIIIGSANLTGKALAVNHEWNVRLISTSQGDYVRQINSQFNKLWDKAGSLDEWIEKYEDFYEKQKLYAATAPVPSLEVARLTPNTMQIRFMEELAKIRRRNETRALLISATGTGKTYAAAFAAREMNPDRVLFLIHREQIARQAKQTFQNVFVSTKTYGMLTGNSNEKDRDIIFSTIQTMSKEDVLTTFDKDHFDLIIVDEVHRAGARSYEKVMEYFTPKFWLGMTASPDRTDGYDIYKLFDHNIAFEIRLQQAMEEELLCPFHYFGITDITIGGVLIDANETRETFSRLTADGRVDHVLEQINFYGYSGDRVKGLVFCSKNDEARELSLKFNQRGYKTIALSGADSQIEREKAIELLTTDNRENYYDYIFTVDIFNEGVDIPEINQVIMLRPTESAIIFVQQLGRGLRKNAGKEFVIVLDFIANYKTNFLIPIALSGDRTYNKDNLRHYLMDGHKVIPGESSISFDEIAKKQIFESINEINNNSVKLYREKYRLLKFKLGRVPSLMDFYEHSEIDPILLLKKFKTYYEFLVYEEPEYQERINHTAVTLLKIFSGFFANGQRPHEAVIVRELLSCDMISTNTVERILLHEYGIVSDIPSIKSAFNYLCGLFSISNEAQLFNVAKITFEASPGVYRKSAEFAAELINDAYCRQISDLVELALMKYQEEYYQQTDDNGLAIRKKYSRKDVCRILNWEKDENPQNMGGYRIKHGTCPIFVTLNKKENIAETIQYEEGFISPRAIEWKTRSNIRLTGTEPRQIIGYQESGLKLFLFVKKSDDADGTDYYYLGRVKPVDWHETTQDAGNGKTVPIVNFTFELNSPVRRELYEYLTDEG